MSKGGLREWTDEEIIVSVYLYRFGYEELGIKYQQIAQLFNRSPNAILFRFANFLNEDEGEAGLSGGSARARKVFKEYKNAPKERLREVVLRILAAHGWRQ